jgi:hypothetical protein
MQANPQREREREREREEKRTEFQAAVALKRDLGKSTHAYLTGYSLRWGELHASSR